MGHQDSVFENSRLNWLQTLRGVAALMVCCFHLRALLNEDYPLGEFLFSNGRLGVPLFFIVNGFIISYTTRAIPGDKPSEVFSFLLRRAIRIIPLYYLATFLWIFITGTFTLYFTEELPQLLLSLLFIPIGDYPPLYLGWTLNFEMFFYFLFGVCLFFGKNRHLVFFTAVLFLVFGYPFLHAQSPFAQDFSFTSVGKSTFAHPFQLLFASGVLLFLIFDKISTLKRYMLWVVPVFLLYFIWHYFKYPHFPFAELLACTLAVFAVLILEKIPFPPPPRFFIKTGDISYSIYLFHPAVIFGMEKLFDAYGMEQSIPGPVHFLVMLIAVWIASFSIHSFIEKRIMVVLGRNRIREIMRPSL